MSSLVAKAKRYRKMLEGLTVIKKKGLLQTLTSLFEELLSDTWT